MSKTKPIEQTTEAGAPSDVWIARLSELLRTVEAMGSEERSAAFSFLKSKYYKEWPSSSY